LPERRHLGNLPGVQALAGLEQQQDALPVLVTKRNENPGHFSPLGRQGTGVVFFHIDYLEYIDMNSSSNFLFLFSSAA
jgi:hypothetical protein